MPIVEQTPTFTVPLVVNTDNWNSFDNHIWNFSSLQAYWRMDNVGTNQIDYKDNHGDIVFTGGTPTESNAVRTYLPKSRAVKYGGSIKATKTVTGLKTAWDAGHATVGFILTIPGTTLGAQNDKVIGIGDEAYVEVSGTLGYELKFTDGNMFDDSHRDDEYRSYLCVLTHDGATKQWWVNGQQLTNGASSTLTNSDITLNDPGTSWEIYGAYISSLFYLDDYLTGSEIIGLWRTYVREMSGDTDYTRGILFDPDIHIYMPATQTDEYLSNVVAEKNLIDVISGYYDFTSAGDNVGFNEVGPTLVNNRAFGMDGVIEIKDLASLTATEMNADWTLEFMVQPSIDYDDMFLMRNEFYWLVIREVSGVWKAVRSATEYGTGISSTGTEYTWMHCVITYDRSLNEIKMYLDTTLIATVPFLGDYENGDDFQIGNSSQQRVAQIAYYTSLKDSTWISDRHALLSSDMAYTINYNHDFIAACDVVYLMHPDFVTGSTLTDLAGNHDATLVGSPTVTANGGMEFNGVDQRLDLTSLAPSSSFTVFAIIKAPAQQNDIINFVSTTSASDRTYHIGFDNAFSWSTDVGNDVGRQTFHGFNNGGWQKIAITRDGSDLKIWTTRRIEEVSSTTIGGQTNQQLSMGFDPAPGGSYVEGEVLLYAHSNSVLDDEIIHEFLSSHLDFVDNTVIIDGENEVTLLGNAVPITNQTPTATSVEGGNNIVQYMPVPNIPVGPYQMPPVTANEETYARYKTLFDELHDSYRLYCHGSYLEDVSATELTYNGTSTRQNHIRPARSIVSGDWMGSLYFTGDACLVENSNLFDTTSNPKNVTFWFLPENNGGSAGTYLDGRGLVCGNDAGALSDFYVIWWNSQVHVKIGTESIASSPTLSINEPHFIAISYDSDGASGGFNVTVDGNRIRWSSLGTSDTLTAHTSVIFGKKTPADATGFKGHIQFFGIGTKIIYGNKYNHRYHESLDVQGRHFDESAFRTDQSQYINSTSNLGYNPTHYIRGNGTSSLTDLVNNATINVVGDISYNQATNYPQFEGPVFQLDNTANTTVSFDIQTPISFSDDDYFPEEGTIVAGGWFYVDAASETVIGTGVSKLRLLTVVDSYLELRIDYDPVGSELTFVVNGGNSVIIATTSMSANQWFFAAIGYKNDEASCWLQDSILATTTGLDLINSPFTWDEIVLSNLTSRGELPTNYNRYDARFAHIFVSHEFPIDEVLKLGHETTLFQDGINYELRDVINFKSSFFGLQDPDTTNGVLNSGSSSYKWIGTSVGSVTHQVTDSAIYGFPYSLGLATASGQAIVAECPSTYIFDHNFVGFMIKIDSWTGTGECDIFRMNGGTNGYEMVVKRVANQDQLFITDENGFDSPAADITLGEWTFVAAGKVLDNLIEDRYALFFNGARVAETAEDPQWERPSKFTIGDVAGGTNGWNGKINFAGLGAISQPDGYIFDNYIKMQRNNLYLENLCEDLYPFSDIYPLNTTSSTPDYIVRSTSSASFVGSYLIDQPGPGQFGINQRSVRFNGANSYIEFDVTPDENFYYVEAFIKFNQMGDTNAGFIMTGDNITMSQDGSNQAITASHGSKNGGTFDIELGKWYHIVLNQHYNGAQWVQLWVDGVLVTPMDDLGVYDGTNDVYVRVGNLGAGTNTDVNVAWVSIRKEKYDWNFANINIPPRYKASTNPLNYPSPLVYDNEVIVGNVPNIEIYNDAPTVIEGPPEGVILPAPPNIPIAAQAPTWTQWINPTNASNIPSVNIPIGNPAPQFDDGGEIYFSIQLEWTGVLANTFLYIPIKWANMDYYQPSIDIEWTGYPLNFNIPIKWTITESVQPQVPITWSSPDVSQYPRVVEDWAPYIELDGVDISSKLRGAINIDYEEDSSAIANFIMVPNPLFDSSVNIDIMSWMNKPVTIDIGIIVNDIEVDRVRRFTGIVSNAVYNPELSIIVFTCSNDIQGYFSQMDKEDIQALLGGYWSADVFESENITGWEHAQDIMSTQPRSVWLDRHRNLRIDDWAAKGTEHFNFTDNARFNNTLKLDRATRRDLINNIKLNADYKYYSLRQRDLQIGIDGDMLLCDFLFDQPIALTKGRVESAIENSDYVLQGEIQYKPFWPAQPVWCPNPYGPIRQQFWVGASSDDIVQSAYFKVSKRWGQTSVERHQINIGSSDSIEYSGKLTKERNTSVSSEYDFKYWEEQDEYTGPDENAVQNAIGDWVLSVDDDADDVGNRAAFDLAHITMTNYCKTEILGSHRKNSITFEAPFHPIVNLSHTVRVQADNLVAKGKVRQVIDKFNIETGEAKTEIQVAISAHGGTGLASDTPITNLDPVEATEAESEYSKFLLLPFYIGGLKNSPPYDEEWAGFITNTSQVGMPHADKNNPAFNHYPNVEVALNFPEITGETVESLDLQNEVDIDVQVPEDLLIITA